MPAKTSRLCAGSCSQKKNVKKASQKNYSKSLELFKTLRLKLMEMFEILRWIFLKKKSPEILQGRRVYEGSFAERKVYCRALLMGQSVYYRARLRKDIPA